MRLFKVIGTQPSSLLFLCSAATEPWRAACVLEEAKHRSLSERLSIWWSTWPKDVLDLNYHTLLWHCQRHAMGVSHTVNTLTQSLHLGSHSRFIIRKRFISRLYKTLDVCHLTRFDKFYSFAPQNHNTGKNMFFGHFIHHKLLKTRITSFWCETVFTTCYSSDPDLKK